MSTSTVATIDTTKPGIPLSRQIRVELRKMFDTRSGFWLMLSILIAGTIATVAVIAFASDATISYSSFGTAIGVPFGLLLPIIAILSVTGEWSQRTGLITFTLTPHRGQVVLAKAISAVTIGVASIIFSFAVGAIGNVVGASLHGIDPVWNVAIGDMLLVLLANILGIMVGFMLGVLIRNSAGAIVAYVAYSYILPGILLFLASSQEWFKSLQPWVDFNYAQGRLYTGSMSGELWANLAVSSIIWFFIPMAIGARAVLRSEVK